MMSHSHLKVVAAFALHKYTALFAVPPALSVPGAECRRVLLRWRMSPSFSTTDSNSSAPQNLPQPETSGGARPLLLSVFAQFQMQKRSGLLRPSAAQETRTGDAAAAGHRSAADASYPRGPSYPREAHAHSPAIARLSALEGLPPYCAANAGQDISSEHDISDQVAVPIAPEAEVRESAVPIAHAAVQAPPRYDVLCDTSHGAAMPPTGDVSGAEMNVLTAQPTSMLPTTTGGVLQLQREHEPRTDSRGAYRAACAEPGTIQRRRRCPCADCGGISLDELDARVDWVRKRAVGITILSFALLCLKCWFGPDTGGSIIVARMTISDRSVLVCTAVFAVVALFTSLYSQARGVHDTGGTPGSSASL